MDHELDPGIDGDDAFAAQRGTPVEMAAANPHPRPGLPDDNGDHSTAPRLPAPLEHVESDSRHGVHPRIWHGDVWYRVQR